MTLTRREFIRRSGLLAAGAVVGPHILTACGGDADPATLDRLRELGVATVGVANEDPFGYFDDDGNLTGAGPAVAAEVMRRLGVPQIRGEAADFGGLISDVDGQRFDLIAAGMFIMVDRCEDIIFSDPDFCALEAFAVRTGEAAGFSDYRSVADADVQIGVIRGSVESEYLKALEVDDARVHKYRRADGLIQALRAREIEVVALNSIALRRVLATADEAIEMTEPFEAQIQRFQTARCGAYGFRDDDQALRDEFNAVLVDMKADDEILPLVEPFGITASEVEAAKGRTAEELCLGAQR